MFKRALCLLLVLLHLATFGPIRDAFAYSAESAKFRLNSGTPSEGGKQSRTSKSITLRQDVIGESYIGKSESQRFVLNSGFIPTIQSNPPALIKDKVIPSPISWMRGVLNLEALNLNNYFFSPDGEALIYDVEYEKGSEKNIRVGIYEGSVSFAQVPTWFGAEKVKFIAKDSDGNTCSSNEITLQVEGPIIEQVPPVVESIPDITVNEGETVIITANASDANEDALTFDYVGQRFTAKEPVRVNPRVWQSQAEWKPTFDDSGTYTVTISATDASGLKGTEEVKINVLNVNQKPVLEPIPDKAIKEGDKLSLIVGADLKASDSDGDALTFVFDSLLNQKGEWEIGFDRVGTYNVQIKAFDGVDYSDPQTLKITVLNTNRPPTGTLSLDKNTVSPQGAITAAIYIDDPDCATDQQKLKFSLKKGDEEILRNDDFTGPYGPRSITFSFIDFGHYTLTLTVTDAEGAVFTTTQNIHVADARPSVNPVMGDFNGDSLLDLGVHDYDSGNWEACLSKAGKFDASLAWLSGFGNSRDWMPMSGDFNGDAKTDIAVYNYISGELKVALSNGSGFLKNDQPWLKVPDASYTKTYCETHEVCSGSWIFESCEDVQSCVNYPYSPWQPFTGNFNGDKYTDFAVYNKDTGEIKVALGSGSGFSSLTQWQANFGTDYIVLGGDFNGDSLTDICLFKKSSGEFKVAFSNTKAFVDGSTWLTGFAADKDVTLSDFNNDGLTDIGYWDKDSRDLNYTISTGAKFVNKGLWRNFGSSSDESVSTGDFNGDGLTDYASFDRDKIGILRWNAQLSTIKPADLVTELDNGIGGKTGITYTYASKMDNNSLPFPVYVAGSIALKNEYPADRKASYRQDFNYSGGYFDPEEREFRGFALVTVTDPLTRNYTQTYFHQGKSTQEAALKGQIRRIAAFDGNSRQISETVNTFEVKKVGQGEHSLGFPALVWQATTAWEENGEHISTGDKFSYDNLGNLLEATNQGDTSIPASEKKANEEKTVQTLYAKSYMYYPEDKAGFNRPLQALIKDKDAKIVSQKSFAYDERGNLAKDTVYILNPITQENKPAISQYSYDNFGNLIATTDALGRQVKTEYETSFYAYPQKVTNTLGHTITYTYDMKLGVVTSVTDPNQHTSITHYDTFGRVTETINADDVVVTTYEYPDFRAKITKQLNLVKREFGDGLGRKYRSESSGEDGDLSRNVVSEVFYNQRGLTEKESLPHYVEEDPGQISYVRYEYDLRGRINKTISDFPGAGKDAQASINYINPLYTESIDPLGHRKGVRKDIWGNITEITEFTKGGVYKTYYEYDFQNNLIKLTDAQKNITQVFYDSIGRKLKMIDPDMGEWSYEYDILGNLIKQTDAKGQVLEFEYDALNRLVAKQGLSPQGTVPVLLATYVYDDLFKPDCIGRLSKVVDQSGSTEFFYDKFGREIKSVKSLRGVALSPVSLRGGAAGADEAISYTVLREYDLLDRLTKLTYPDGEAVNYTYDTNSGLLEKVSTVDHRLSTVDYVKDISYNAKGQIKAIQYGNGTQTDYTYGNDLRLQHILTQNPAPGTSDPVLQNLTYDFDNNGNLKFLTDNLKSNRREYSYDDLDRLTQAKNTPDPRGGYTDFYYDYDPIGNMVYKSDVGIMSYGQGLSPQGTVPDKPHALTSAGGYTYKYDANGNMAQGKNKTLEYDVENRLAKVNESGSVSTFLYDGDGGRVKKSTVHSQQSTETSYIGSLFEIDSSGKTTKHIFVGSNRVCSIDKGSAATVVYYYHSDHLGSSNVISNQDGGVFQRCEYTPYGSTALNEGVDIAKHKFTGKELDSTGLYFYGARYYDPEIGRFITADTIAQAPYDPQSLNRYSYCRNNPINYIDPSGHSWSWGKFWSSFVGALVAVALTVILGPAGFGMSMTMAGMWGGMVGGALSGGLQGGWQGALMGAAIGGVLGAAGGWAAGGEHYWAMGGMFAAGVGVAAATDSWDSFTGGFVGGLCGAAVGGGITNAYKEQFGNHGAGNGFRSNATVQAEQRRLANLQAMIDEKRALSLGRAPTELETAELRQAFPSLSDFRITGESTRDYNCIAWTLGKTDSWVNPTSTIEGMDQLYGSCGYVPVPKNQAQIALFVKDGVPQHGAVRVSGDWYESKLGSWPRIVHRLGDLEGDAYGSVDKFYGK
ncbi:MAG: RHS repeat-associated core domain-containing protein [Candidatus Omnitrophota bacterium]